MVLPLFCFQVSFYLRSAESLHLLQVDDGQPGNTKPYDVSVLAY